MACDSMQKEKCPCTFECSRHGKCCACIEHHVPRGQFPACVFSAEAEAVGDRGYEALQKDRANLAAQK